MTFPFPFTLCAAPGGEWDARGVVPHGGGPAPGPTLRHLLIVWHSRTGAARQMAQAACQGARDAALELDAASRLQVSMLNASSAQPDDLLKADAYLFCAPENLAALSGDMKEFFDRAYYAVLDRLNGRPYALLIAAGSDGSMAARQAERIATGWRLERVAPTRIVNTDAQSPEAILAPKQITEDDRAICHETGGTLAALLLL